MSQSFHQGIYSFSNGYERSPMTTKQGVEWINQRVQGFELQQQQQQQVQVEVNSGEPQVYDDTGGGMLTEMIDFSRDRGKAANHLLLDGQIQSSYRWSQKQQLPLAVVNEAELLLMNQQHVKASSSSPSPASASSLHMSISNSSDSQHPHLHLQGYQLENPSQFSWIRSCSNEDDSTKSRRTMEGQGLSLSLSSSLPNLEAAKFQEFRQGDGGMYFFDQGVGPSMNFCGFKNQEPNQNTLSMVTDYSSQVHGGLPASSRIGNVLRNSRYLRAAQELLEEFCCVAKGNFKSPKNENPRSISIVDSVGGAVSSTSSKDRPPLSAAVKAEYQRKKVKLLSMLDEVEARYTHYHEQMQAIVHSFDSVLGHGAAVSYTNLAQKAMSRHFRSIKDAILDQMKVTCEVLGDKDVNGTIGLTKGETPRLRLLEQKFRQQKAIHQLGMLDPDTWRPQRGLPERSVNILRAWLFEHFLCPYPSDADKHLLSRQTGLSKNQVSNWFINARVRLWKPMVEDIYKEDVKEVDQQEETTVNHAANELAKSDSNSVDEDHHSQNQNNLVSAQTPMRISNSKITTTISSSSTTTVTLVEGRRSEINATEKDPSRNTINYGQYTLGNQAILQGTPTTTTTTTLSSATSGNHDQTLPAYGCFTAIPEAVSQHGNITARATNNFTTSSLVEMGTSQGGDVSLTLGLRHPSSNLPRKSIEFSIRDFGAF